MPLKKMAPSSTRDGDQRAERGPISRREPHSADRLIATRTGWAR